MVAVAGASSHHASGHSRSASAAAGVIKVGAIADLTGDAATFPQVPQGAKAYFDWLNKHGGINGKKVDFTTLDSADAASTSGQDAHQLVDQDKVVALVGSASIYDCPVNASFYKQSNIVDVVAGVLPQCFESPNLAPINDGLFEGTGVSLVYAVKTLHKTRPCILFGDTAPEPALMAKVVAAFTKATHVKLASEQEYPTNASDWQPFILKLSQAKCDVVVPAMAGPQLVAFEKEFTQMGERGKITDIQLSSAYSTQIAAAIAPGANGLYANSEFLPFTGSGVSNPALKPFLAAMKAEGQPASAFAEAGYLAAQMFTQVVKTIKGPITNATVTAALKHMKPFVSPLLGNPWQFGTTQPNHSSRFVQLKNGVWQPVTSTWTTLPIS
jgi:branched-chain amino acid transport system substrate-binding protein